MTPAGGVATGTPDLLARPLEEVPEVTHALRSFGLGELIPHTVVARVGRNDNWSGTTTTGEHVVVKRLSGPAVDVARRQARLVRFESWARGGVFGSLRTPACLGWDESAAVFVHREVRDGRPGNELMVEQTFTEEQSAQVGRAVAELHEARLASDSRWDTDADLLPSPRLLAALPLELVRGCSAAQLQAWSLLQHDDAVKTAVLNLLSEGRRVLWVPSHCDLRVDQVLLDARGPVVCDWEEFRLADPARDVGSYVGEWIYRAVLDIPTRRGQGAADEDHLDTAAVLARGVHRIAALRPVITAFWGAYTAHRRPDEGLAIRATAFAGWHLLDRLLAGAMSAPRLQPVQRAAAGVGRRALLSPQRFAGSLGLRVQVRASVPA